MSGFTPQNGSQALGSMIHNFRRKRANGMPTKVEYALAHNDPNMCGDITSHSMYNDVQNANQPIFSGKTGEILEGILDNSEQNYLTALSDYNQQNPQGAGEQSSGGLLSLGLSFGPGSASGDTTASEKESVLANAAAKNAGNGSANINAAMNNYNKMMWQKTLNDINSWRR